MKKFTWPELEVSEIDIVDIITASGEDDEWSGNTGGDDTAWN